MVKQFNVSNLIGNALTFYAKFPAEVNLIWGNEEDEEIYQNHFGPTLNKEEFVLNKEEFIELCQRVGIAGDSASEEAKFILDHCTERLLSKEFIKNSEYLKPNLIRPTGSNIYWRRKFRVFKKGAKVSLRSSIMCGFYFSADENGLFVRSWLWVKGVDRETLGRMLNNISGIQYSDYSPNKNDIYLASLNILDAAKRGISIESLIDELLKPLESIKPESWLWLFENAKK